MLSEEQQRKTNKHLFKSVESFRKYNEELGEDSMNKVAGKESSPVRKILQSTETQTDALKNETLLNDPVYTNKIKNKLLNIKYLLTNENANIDSLKSNNSLSILNLEKLTNEIENIIRNTYQTNMNELREQNSKLVAELRELRESKLKLESLYKVKCKADLNKSAEIKKLEIGYQNELMKFRNDFNLDPVRYLENQLNQKTNQLNENIAKFSNLLKLVNNYKLVQSNLSNSSCCFNTLNKFKEFIRDSFGADSSISCFHETTYNCSNDSNNTYNSSESSLNMFKKNPIKLVSNEYNSNQYNKVKKYFNKFFHVHFFYFKK
jgi:hypothetical protein